MKTLLTVLGISIVFWNLENFFAPDPDSEKHWTSSRFYSKCEGIAKTIMLIADEEGELPDVVCFAEVGDSTVMARLLHYTSLFKAGYRIIHYESPDHRGIDCALLYKKASLSVLYSQPCHLYDSLGNIMPTRDILLAKFVSRDNDTLISAVDYPAVLCLVLICLRPAAHIHELAILDDHSLCHYVSTAVIFVYGRIHFGSIYVAINDKIIIRFGGWNVFFRTPSHQNDGHSRQRQNFSIHIKHIFVEELRIRICGIGV